MKMYLRKLKLEEPNEIFNLYQEVLNNFTAQLTYKILQGLKRARDKKSICPFFSCVTLISDAIILSIFFVMKGLGFRNLCRLDNTFKISSSYKKF